MSATDAMVGRLQNEIEERSSFQNGLIEAAQNQGRDLNANEMELYQSAATRIADCAAQLEPLSEGIRIASDSARRSRELNAALGEARDGRRPTTVEYRTAGAFIMDKWQAGAGLEEAKNRLNTYERAAAHQTTADNLGVIPEPVVGTIIDRIDNARPIVSALGPQGVPGGMFKRPRVTQHTSVGLQTAEKTELASRKMLISEVPVTMATYGGYVNVARQNIDWSMPQIMDIVVNDLAGQYAIETEAATADLLVAQATAGPTVPADPTGADVANGIWGAAGLAYSAMAGAGNLLLAVSPDVMGLVGPLFAPVNPTNAQSSGFSAGSFGSGPMGAISGIAVVMSAQLPPGTALVINTAAAEVYEQRVGTLQVTEPSVLGVQVAYAGYFAPVVLDPAGIIDISVTVTP